MMVIGLLAPRAILGAEPNRPPVFNSPQVTPYNKNDRSLYVFSIRYTSPDHIPPQSIQVFVDGQAMSLTAKGKTDYDAVYSSSPVAMDVGHHKYYFACDDGRGFTNRSPRYGEWDGPYVGRSWRSMFNTYPVLNDGHLVQGDAGDVGSYFTFMVNYSDYDSTPPKSVNVVIDGRPHAMKLHKGVPENATYIYNAYFDTMPHAFYFTADDPGGAHVTYPTEGFLRGPSISDVPNTNPELTDPEVAPLIGAMDEGYTFSVRYWDAERDPPAIIQVYVNDFPHNMKLWRGTRYDGVYRFTMKLPPSGFHHYYFRAEDGRGGETADPMQGYIHGPIVTTQ